jgi:carbon-monoxide dehydrogenase small subunit
MTQVAFTLNGAPVSAEVEPRTSLAEFLRGTQHLTAAHLGCEHGVCGACTIVLNGAPARSCITFAAALEGADVRTLEGLEHDPLMKKMRAAFHEEHALQCGFCTPGMLITSRDIAGRFAHADEKKIRTELAGNLCRCTGYVGIVKAVQRVMTEVPVELRLHGAPAMLAAAPAMAVVGAIAAAPRMPAAAVSAPAGEKGWSRVEDHFTVARGRAEVWQLFGKTADMARCLPGFELTSEQGNDLSGVMHVAFGPIKTGFACTARIERDPERMTGIIFGSGVDDRGGSRAKGQVTYRLLETGEATTRVAITLDYQLQGPLAQFSRSGLVRDFTGRLIASFAQNLSAGLLGQTPAAAASSVGVGSLLWAMLRDRVKRWFRA